MLMSIINQRLETNDPSQRSQPIDQAILQFFDQFRKIYVGDQVHKSSKAYLRMSEVLNVTDEADILDILVKKIITNLKCWGDDDMILVGWKYRTLIKTKCQKKTLQLLSELAVGYATVRKLVKLDSVKQLLHNHQEFPFLRIQDSFEKSTSKRLKVIYGKNVWWKFSEPNIILLRTWSTAYGGPWWGRGNFRKVHDTLINRVQSPKKWAGRW